MTLHMYFIVANSMSIGSTLAQIFLGFRLEQLGSRRPLIRAVGLSRLLLSLIDGFSSPFGRTLAICYVELWLGEAS